MATTNGKQQAAQGHGAAPPRTVADDISGTYSDAASIKRMLEQAEERYILLGGLAVGDIPDGFSVMMSTFKVNPNSKSEIFDVGMGKFGLSGIVLKKIADAAGMSMVDSKCMQSSMHYVAWQVTSARQCLDGSVRRVTASRVMDLRDSSGVVAAMRRKAAQKDKDAENQLWEQRMHIGQHAETKAYLRTIRSMLGVDTYTKEELAKPFAVAKLQLTGRSSNPQTQMVLTMMMAQQALGGIGMLYGAPQPQMMGMGMPQMGGGQQVPQMGMGSPGPMILDTDDADDAAGAATQPPPPAKPPPPRPRRNAADCFMPGKDKGKKVGDATDEDLAYWRDRLTKDFAEGKIGEQWAARSQEQLDAIIAVMRHRGLMPPAPAAAADAPRAPSSQPGEDEGPSSEDYRQMQALEREAAGTY